MQITRLVLASKCPNWKVQTPCYGLPQHCQRCQNQFAHSIASFLLDAYTYEPAGYCLPSLVAPASVVGEGVAGDCVVVVEVFGAAVIPPWPTPINVRAATINSPI